MHLETENNQYIFNYPKCSAFQGDNEVVKISEQSCDDRWVLQIALMACMACGTFGRNPFILDSR